MRSYLASLGVAGVVSACLVSGSAFANSMGISGRSGKQGSSLTCAECHTGGSAPTVTIEGPTTLAPGATGNYTLVVRGGPAAGAGYNVAVSDNGGTLNPGTGSYKLSGEVTHKNIQAFSGGEARFDFTLVAPSTPGTVTLYGAGNSVNENGTDQGDASAATTLNVNVATGGGDGGGGDDGGGCAAAGGIPLLGAALVLLGTRLRRRR
ncbi:MXAN_6652 family MXYO-CTERM-anchored protein [Myxococcus sp. AB056]|uniref:MXAN_6652 family MXYO-CTERM-anchored protein n=1 Tax=Myxococcus sp. AB056 TaxID=2562792 RepID=UPI00114644F6|nr:MXAN_6652 family MXYO-CTERM-anchored protein [Myxococcus sp. AB056]